MGLSSYGISGDTAKSLVFFCCSLILQLPHNFFQLIDEELFKDLNLKHPKLPTACSRVPKMHQVLPSAFQRFPSPATCSQHPETEGAKTTQYSTGTVSERTPGELCMLVWGTFLTAESQASDIKTHKCRKCCNTKSSISIVPMASNY